ncbi:head GIN domain-containing protein [Mangrovibacterium sp.]|uniref:head GIN domain-containing protein n=1 Tax=Mangrovibacterium sp. TaxID=1961364 RepID=UPI0035628B2A
MKTRMKNLLLIVLLIIGTTQVQAADEIRELAAFSEITLRVPGKLHLEQGSKQSVELVGKASTLDQIVTEVKDRQLIIRFKTKNLLWKDFETGKIEIFITVPDITALTVSGSGDIINDGPINSRILSLTASGSGSIKLDDLVSERIKTTISGSGNVELDGNESAQDLNITISGSGGFNGEDFEAEDVTVRIAGSGSARIHCNNSLIARIAGSGDVLYNGNPRIDQSIAGSGNVKEL